MFDSSSSVIRDLVELFGCFIRLDWQAPLYGLAQDQGRASLLAPSTPALSVSFGNSVKTPHKTIPALFSLHARSYADSVAIEDMTSSITYSQLELQSDSLALLLRSKGLFCGDRVCLLVQRSIPFVVGILAILKSGAAYIPLDGGIVTDEILDEILLDVKPRLILASKRYLPRALGRSVPTLDLDTEIMTLAPQPPARSPSAEYGVPSDEAYVIYTSGTTGKPKGVSVSHKNVVNLVSVEPGNLGIAPGVRISQLLNVAFDMCAWEIFASLCNGGTLVLRPSGSFSRWTSVIQTVHVVVATPSILSKYHPDQFPGVVRVAVAGERCSQDLADAWAAKRIFLNCCGPTEVTIINTVHRHQAGMPVSIGKPTPNNSVYVLDDDLNPVPVGSTGVLWAGGSGICAGYVNLPDLTKAKFKRDPFFTSPMCLMYNTGDIGRQLRDGSFEHLGRIDDQIKIKGFRVELDGVAAVIESCPGVLVAAALCVDGELWGVYTTHPSTRVDSSSLKEHVARIQPYYAVPASFLAIGAFPLSSNGKIDKSQLHTHIAAHRRAKGLVSEILT
ncbi:AMP-binding protein [Mycena vulgaris]|nr:AMP-binding protein [Mycena vulgaris]